MSNKYPGGIITSGAPAGYSVFFDGTGDSLVLADNAAFEFGSGDFTVEAWVYVTATPGASGASIITKSSATYPGGYEFNFVVQNDRKAFFGFYTTSQIDLTGTTALSLNTWAHLAVSRSGSNFALFVNGTREATQTSSGTIQATSSSLYLGDYGGGSRTLTGYISNARIVKGTAVYDPTQTTIRVPTQLFAITNTSLLTCNSPAIVDQSSNNFTITANGNAAVSTFTPFTGTQLVPNPNTLANTQGVWSISDAAYWMSQNKWPMPPNYPLQSLRFNSADSAYLTRTPTSTSNRQTFTWSGWVKIGKNPYSTGGYLFSSRQSGTDNFGININTSMQLVVDGAIGGTAINLISTPVYRDSSAWYHILVAVDTTQATSSNRVKVYVNGTQVTAFGTATYPTQSNTSVNLNTAIHNVSGYNNSSNYFDGYMADVNFVDGQALTPSSFGANDPNTGVWSPVPYSGTYGTNGFRLSFQDNTGTTATTLGRDYSGNGNNWTPNNFSVAAGSGNDSLTDGPTNWGIDYGNGGEVRGNYCTLNPLSIGTGVTLSNGGLDFSSATSNSAARSTFGVASGKWYWEVTVTTASPYFTIGVTDTSTVDNNTYVGATATSYSYFTNNGNKYNNGSASAYGATIAQNDVVGVALDMDAGTLTFYKNGVSQGTAFTGITGTKQPAISINTAATNTASCNFGQRPFAYPAPSGFKVLCTTNLPIPTVGATSTTLADDYFNVVTYTGTGSSLSVTGVGFQPDFVWVKGRSGATDHALYDAVRGVQKQLESNTTTAETTETTGLTAFGTDGFTVGSLAQVNTNAATYVGWAWKANGAGSSNTAGTLSSTVSANQTAGISVVTYSGVNTSPNTVGHGLGVAPKFWLIKNRSSASGNWVFNYVLNGVVYYMFLNTTATANAQGSPWSTLPSSSVVTLGGNDANTCQSGSNYVMYAFAEVAGFSKFGSYTGNGSADGPFVYTGFRPRYVMIKRTDVARDWVVMDTARSTYNVVQNTLFPNSSAAEDSTLQNEDILSNGFKLRTTDASWNASGGTYIFAAFAEAPFNYSRAR